MTWGICKRGQAPPKFGSLSVAFGEEPAKVVPKLRKHEKTPKLAVELIWAWQLLQTIGSIAADLHVRLSVSPVRLYRPFWKWVLQRNCPRGELKMFRCSACSGQRHGLQWAIRCNSLCNMFIAFFSRIAKSIQTALLQSRGHPALLPGTQVLVLWCWAPGCH